MSTNFEMVYLVNYSNRTRSWILSLLLLMMLFTVKTGQAQQMSMGVAVLACNDNIQISLDSNCQVNLSLDMLLEDDVASDPCLIIEVKDENGDIIFSGPSPVLDASHRDRCFSYAVRDTCTKNYAGVSFVLKTNTYQNWNVQTIQ